MSEKQPRTTIYDTFRPAEDRRVRRLPGLLASAFRLFWTSAPTEFLVVGALQLLTGAAVLLLLVNQLVATLDQRF